MAVGKYTNAELKSMKAKVPVSSDEKRAKKISL